MKKINVKKIKSAVAKLAVEANLILRGDIIRAIRKAYLAEKDRKAKNILKILLSNAAIAKYERIAICQDTGMAVVFIEIGQGVSLTGGSLSRAVNDGIREGYKKGHLRKSVVADPIMRVNTKDNAPAVIHEEIVPGNKVRITVVPKGFGSENKTAVKMLNPTQGADEIGAFVIESVMKAGADACPPYIIGVGLGGTLDKACLLSKKALMRHIDKRSAKRHIAGLEKGLFKKINALKIGPMGFGGGATCLGVNIETYPTHIAGLPVCVSISCHATRSATATL
ncbi:MAG: fumarate hydratase [Candidatus Omnitrophica bacterium]|nr:fumarate hydratase [Candidatus Omnitrophota bacterium]MDD5546858.1 fumarate hydratase [Candidatus Omnitrophota bacterium]